MTPAQYDTCGTIIYYEVGRQVSKETLDAIDAILNPTPTGAAMKSELIDKSCFAYKQAVPGAKCDPFGMAAALQVVADAMPVEMHNDVPGNTAMFDWRQGWNSCCKEVQRLLAADEPSLEQKIKKVLIPYIASSAIVGDISAQILALLKGGQR